MAVEHARAQAALQVKALLGVNVTSDELFDLAADVLGARRAERCRGLVKQARLTRRAMACAAVAEVIVATRRLGATWWDRGHPEMNRRGTWQLMGTPEALLEVGTAPGDYLAVGSSLGLLGSWACDDAANDEWGRPVDCVDLNDPRLNDRIRIPPSAKVGDHIIARYDPGCRVWADVVERESDDPEFDETGRRRGRLRTVLAESRCCDAAEAGWAWGMATNGAAVRLRGEIPGAASDPLNRPIERSASRSLYREALELGASDEVLGEPWTTNGELLDAALRLGWPYELTAIWHRWGQAAEAVVDGIG
jgi:hypothetical protein